MRAVNKATQFIVIVRRGLLGLLAVAVILLALGFSLFRLLLPELPALQQDIEAMASEAVGKPLHIGEMTASWAGWGPELVFKDLSIRSPVDGDELIVVRRLTVGTHIFQLLTGEAIRPAWVEAEGLRLIVEQEDSGRLKLRGFDSKAGEKGEFLGPFIDFLSARGSIKLGRTEVVWVPAPSFNIEPESAWFDIGFTSGGDSYHIELKGQPPASIGRNIELVLDAKGKMADMMNMRGEMFAHVDGFQLHSPWVQPLLAFSPVQVHAGELASGDINVRWDRQNTTSVTSHLSLQEMQLSMANETRAQRESHLVEAFEGDLSWASHQSASQSLDPLTNLAQLGKRWTLSSDKAVLTVAGEPVVLRGFALNSVAGSTKAGTQAFSGRVDSVEWAGVFDQARGLPFSESMGGALQQLRPAGTATVDRFTISRAANTAVGLTANGSFSELSWNTGKPVGDPDAKGWPGFTNVSGKYQLNGDSVLLELDSKALSLNWPWLYEGKRVVDSVAAVATVNLKRDAEGVMTALHINSESVKLAKQGATADVGLDVEVALGIQPLDGHIKLNALVNNGTVPLVKTFIPAFTPDAAAGWLQTALLAGKVNAKLSIDGPLLGFPYEQNEGVFLCNASVTDGALAFAEGWPAVTDAAADLEFRNLSLYANVHSAKTAEVPVDSLRVSIPNLKDTNVNVLAATEAPLGDLLRYVRRSPLHEPVAPLMKGLTGDGNAKLSLALDVPAATPEALTVSGELDLLGARVHSSDLIRMRDINGRARFTRSRVLADDLTAVFHGFDTVAKLDLSLEGGDMLVTAKTKLDLESNEEQKRFIAGFLPAWFLDTMSGSAVVDVDLSGRDGAAPAEKIRLTSSLKGLVIAGPENLNKSAEQLAPFELLLDRSVTNGMRVTAHAQDFGGADLWLSDEDGGELRRAEFAAGNTKATLPEQDEIGVVADLPAGDLDSLLHWFSQQQGVEVDEVVGAEARNLLLPDFLDYLTLRSDEFKAFGINWHALNANITRHEDEALLTLSSAEGGGTVLVPDRVVSAEQIADLGEAARALQKRRLAEQIKADFDYLYLPDLVRKQATEAVEKETAAPPALDPRELPVVKATIKDARYMGVRLGELVVETEPGVSGLVMRTLRSRGGAMDIDSSGRWDVYDGQHSSEIKVAVNAKDWASVLAGVDMADVLGAKKGKINLNLQWPGAMSQFDAAAASGRFSVDFETGQIYQINPGIGRVLGLFSFYTLPRRLLLDFSDLAKSGLTFDRISGDFTVNDGSAWTNNLTIKARGADASIVGRAGMVAQDYDQRITVRPQLGGGTAVVGALVSGIGVGAILLLGNELLGHPFDELGVLRYHLTGSWDKPLLNGEAISADVKPKQRNVKNIRLGQPFPVEPEPAG